MDKVATVTTRHSGKFLPLSYLIFYFCSMKSLFDIDQIILWYSCKLQEGEIGTQLIPLQRHHQSSLHSPLFEYKILNLLYSPHYQSISFSFSSLFIFLQQQASLTPTKSKQNSTKSLLQKQARNHVSLVRNRASILDS